jgi:predicted secreted protein
MRAIDLAAAFLLAVTPALAQEKKPSLEDVKKDIAAHRQLAQVHENAAKCLEAGKPEKECHDQLQK